MFKMCDKCNIFLFLVACLLLLEGCSPCKEHDKVRVVGPGYDCVGTIYNSMGSSKVHSLRCDNGEVYHHITNYRIIK